MSPFLISIIVGWCFTVSIDQLLVYFVLSKQCRFPDQTALWFCTVGLCPIKGTQVLNRLSHFTQPCVTNDTLNESYALLIIETITNPNFRRILGRVWPDFLDFFTPW